MAVRLVRADDEVSHRHDLVIGNYRRGKVHRAGKSDLCAGNLNNILRVRKCDLGRSRDVRELNLVYLPVAADQNGIKLAVAVIYHRLDKALCVLPEESGNLIDRPCVRSLDLMHVLHLFV